MPKAPILVEGMKLLRILSVVFLPSALSITAQTNPQTQPGLPERILVPGIDPPFRPIQPVQRLTWFTRSTVGVQSLGVGLLSDVYRTALNEPPEYGRTWKGFGKRYGMRLTGVATSNAMEAGLGALWDEDPRYFRTVGRPFGGRIKHVVKLTFLAYSSDGSFKPAYARHIGNFGSSYLSNTWRTQGEASGQDAFVRGIVGIAGRMGSNAFAEFWPDLRQRLFGRKRP